MRLAGSVVGRVERAREVRRKYAIRMEHYVAILGRSLGPQNVEGVDELFLGPA